MINVIIDRNAYQYEKGIILSKICDDFQKDYEFPILVALVDNDIYELNKSIDKDCSIKFITLLDELGNKIYQKGLIFLLNYCFRKLYGYEKELKVCHSLDKSILIYSDLDINGDVLNNISSKMNEVVEEGLNISKCLVKRRDARKYFEQINDLKKANSFKYIANHYVTLYKIDDYYNYLYCKMPISTSVFKDFKLKVYSNNKFILQFPTTDGNIPEFFNHEKVVAAYKENYKLSEKLNIYTSSDLNEIVSHGEINSIIKIDEVIASNRLLNIATDIYNKKDDIKLVLLAGPSSSGKTTTARKLTMFLKSFGLNPISLSIDDYFKDRVDTPKLDNGDYDFESINAIDVDLFNSHLIRLLNSEEVSMPTFNFTTGEKEYLGKNVKLKKGDILVIEGLHAINEELTKSIPRENKFKIFLSPLTDLNIDDQNMVSTADLRLIRRIVRDNRTRGYTALDTIRRWNNVRDGEIKYIFPYQDDVDCVYNTALIYEIGVLRLYAEPLLCDISIDDPYYEEVKRLLNFLGMFLAIPTEGIPSESIVREFIGNSFFEEGK